MKIAHISDIHLDKYHKPLNYLRTLQLFEYINENRFDHVIISGDLTENAEKSSLEMARDLFKKFGLLKSQKLTVTIGNHDIYGGVHFAEDIVNFPAKCKKTDFDEKVKVFGSYFGETFSKKDIPGGKLFPSIKIFDEFVLINLNSNARYSMLKNPFASKGEITKEQLALIDGYFKLNIHGDKHRIAVTHHHFCKDVIEETKMNSVWQAVERQTMKLTGKKSIIKSLKQMGVSTVLHGHLHESTEYNRKDIKFYNSGGSVLGPGNENLKINVINISKEEISNEFIHLPYKEKAINNTVHFYIPGKIIPAQREEICLN